MLNKINKEIDDFTNTIKELKGCDDMLNYMNSNIHSSIKLLMFASKTFSLYGKIMLFFVISLTGLLVISSLGMGTINIALLSFTLVLFFLMLVYIMYYRKNLILYIEKSKNIMKENLNN